MWTVFLGGLRHQAYVRHAAHGGWIKRTVFFTIVDNHLVDTGVAAIRNTGFGILQFAFGIPHFAGIANHRGHGGIYNHVARYVQVGDALVGIHHRQCGASGVQRFNVAFNFRLFIRWQGFDFSVEIAQTVVQVYAQLAQYRRVFFQHWCVEHRDKVTEDNRVRHFHHGGFQVYREQYTLVFSVFNLRGDIAAQYFFAQYRGINNFASEDFYCLFQYFSAAIVGNQFDFYTARLSDQRWLFAAVEITRRHVRHVRFGVSRPSTHFVWVFARVVFYWQWCTAIRVTFTQYRVYRRTFNFVVTRFGVFFIVIRWHFRVIRQVVTLCL